MKVFLTGFMGCGKTAVGRALAARLDVPFVDLDERVVAAAGREIRVIFAEEGEAAFRRLEGRALEAVVAEPGSRVVATGGGTVAREGVAERLRQAGTVVWLDVPFERVAERLRGEEAAIRPLFADPERARRLFRDRRSWYRNCDLRLEVAQGEGPDELAARIQQELGSSR